MDCEYTVYEFDYSKETIEFKREFIQPAHKEAILSATRAIEYADSLLQSESDEKIVDTGLNDDYAIINISFDSTKNIWMVSYGKKSPDEHTVIVGGGCSIAFKAQNGEVLAVWSGE